MVYETQIWGMHLFWWFVWVFLLIWIFTTPYAIPGQRSRRLSSLDILRNRFASGKISKEEYQSSKAILESDLLKAGK